MAYFPQRRFTCGIMFFVSRNCGSRDLADLRHSLDFFIFPFSKINELQSPQGTQRADIASGGAALPADGDARRRGAGTSLGEEAALASVPKGVLQAQGQVRRGEDGKETRVYAEAAKGQEHEGTESAATRVTPGEGGAAGR